MSTIVYLNGEFIPREKASISPDDRGFYFADGVYEVIKYYKGKLPKNVSDAWKTEQDYTEYRIAKYK